jgi:hypothetical protein
MGLLRWVGVSPVWCDLENREVIPWAWQEVKGDGMSINDAGVTVGPAGREWMWLQWGGVAPP